MSSHDIVVNVIQPDYPELARRINALLWAYERGALRHRMLTEPMIRRLERRPSSDSPSQDRSITMPPDVNAIGR